RRRLGRRHGGLERCCMTTTSGAWAVESATALASETVPASEMAAASVGVPAPETAIVWAPATAGAKATATAAATAPAPAGATAGAMAKRSEEHTSELQSRENLVCRLLLEKKKQQRYSDKRE